MNCIKFLGFQPRLEIVWLPLNLFQDSLYNDFNINFCKNSIFWRCWSGVCMHFRRTKDCAIFCSSIASIKQKLKIFMVLSLIFNWLILQLSSIFRWFWLRYSRIRVYFHNPYKNTKNWLYAYIGVKLGSNCLIYFSFYNLSPMRSSKRRCL